MRKILCVTIGAVLLSVAAVSAQSANPTTDEQKTLYALGLAISQSLGVFNLSEAELAMVNAGLTDGVLKREPKVNVQEFMPKVQQLQQSRLAAVSEVEQKAGAEFLAKAAAEKGATKTDSGLVFSTITAGKGDSPKATDKVKVHYHGTLTNGEVFDSSTQRGEPVTFPLNGVIPCWTEGVQRMKVGEKSRLVCPSSIAYGDRGAPPKIKPGSTLIFEVELLEIVKEDAAGTEGTEGKGNKGSK
jgi:FKBP-type peptidyl-prolyl cis-trans isomerase FkpA